MIDYNLLKVGMKVKVGPESLLSKCSMDHIAGQTLTIKGMKKCSDSCGSNNRSGKALKVVENDYCIPVEAVEQIVDDPKNTSAQVLKIEVGDLIRFKQSFTNLFGIGRDYANRFKGAILTVTEVTDRNTFKILEDDRELMWHFDMVESIVGKKSELMCSMPIVDIRQIYAHNTGTWVPLNSGSKYPIASLGMSSILPTSPVDLEESSEYKQLSDIKTQSRNYQTNF
jgi:hypothetical protein